jgi:hypothetical protein
MRHLFLLNKFIYLSYIRLEIKNYNQKNELILTFWKITSIIQINNNIKANLEFKRRIYVIKLLVIILNIRKFGYRL